MSPDRSRDDDRDLLHDAFHEAAARGASFLDDPAGARRAGSRRVARQRATAGAIAAAVGVVAVLSAGALGPRPSDPAISPSPPISEPAPSPSVSLPDPTPSTPTTTSPAPPPSTTTEEPVLEEWPTGVPLLDGGHTLAPLRPEGGGPVEDWMLDPCHRGDLLAGATLTEEWEAGHEDAEYPPYRVAEQLVRFPDAEAAADLGETILADAVTCPEGPTDEAGPEKWRYSARRFDLQEGQEGPSPLTPFPSDDVIFGAVFRFTNEDETEASVRTRITVVRHGSLVALYAFLSADLVGEYENSSPDTQLARDFANAAVG